METSCFHGSRISSISVIRRKKFVFNFRQRLSVSNVGFRVSRPEGLRRHAGQSTETRIRYFEVKENPAQGTFRRRINERDRSNHRDLASTHRRYFENSNFDTENRTRIVRALIERMPLRQPRR